MHKCAFVIDGRLVALTWLFWYTGRLTSDNWQLTSDNWLFYPFYHHYLLPNEHLRSKRLCLNIITYIDIIKYELILFTVTPGRSTTRSRTGAKRKGTKKAKRKPKPAEETLSVSVIFGNLVTFIFIHIFARFLEEQIYNFNFLKDRTLFSAPVEVWYWIYYQ